MQFTQQQFNFSPVSFHPQSNAVKRHQSFHGFQNREAFNFSTTPNLSQSFIQPLSLSYWSQQNPSFISCWSQQNIHGSIFPYSHTNLNQNQFFVRNPFNTFTPTTRVVGRKECQIALGQVVPKKPLPRTEETTIKTDKCHKKKVVPSSEKRFGSLEIKKHRCYSPTFYSLRCRKHAKKRPIIYAIPKKIKSQVVPLNSENLTDSIQISEQNVSQSSNSPPKPTPRCRKIKPNAIYQNTINNSNIENSKTLDSSNDGSVNLSHEISTTEAIIHERSNNESTTSNSNLTNKESPTVMVKPSFVKPKVESPKGALSLQIHAKLKRNESPPTPDDTNPTKEADTVPKMPIMDQWNTNKLNPSQVCVLFFF